MYALLINGLLQFHENEGRFTDISIALFIRQMVRALLSHF